MPWRKGQRPGEQCSPLPYANSATKGQTDAPSARQEDMDAGYPKTPGLKKAVARLSRSLEKQEKRMTSKLVNAAHEAGGAEEQFRTHPFMLRVMRNALDCLKTGEYTAINIKQLEDAIAYAEGRGELPWWVS